MAVTVIGGYLGSGKTTLVNHLLNQTDERIAVLVNDFGQVNVDLDLIESSDDNTIELSNGCICCSMVDGFSVALDTIVALDPRPDRLVIEASGVADPAQVAGYGHGPGLALDAVVVLADAETIRKTVEDKYVGQTVRQQLASAQVLVINKVDLVEAAELKVTVDWLRAECPDAFLLTTTNSEIAPEVLFGRSPRQTSAVHRGPTEHDHHHHPEQIFETTTFAPAAPQSRADIDQLMASLASTTVRAKGLVHLAEKPDSPFVLQRVGRRWSLRPSPNPWPGTPATQIVIITLAGADQ